MAFTMSQICACCTGLWYAYSLCLRRGTNRATDFLLCNRLRGAHSGSSISYISPVPILDVFRLLLLRRAVRPSQHIPIWIRGNLAENESGLDGPPRTAERHRSFVLCNKGRGLASTYVKVLLTCSSFPRSTFPRHSTFSVPVTNSSTPRSCLRPYRM